MKPEWTDCGVKQKSFVKNSEKLAENCALAIMTKAPRVGQVKTRLSPPLTLDEAAALNACFLRDTAVSIEEACREGNSQPVAVFTPDDAQEEYVNLISRDFYFLPQRGVAFGERLLNALTDLLAQEAKSVCLIDSDSPTLPVNIFRQVVEHLSEEEDRIVIGPSCDGGYYLIGLKKKHARIFSDIDWSTEQVCAQTKERAAEIEVPVIELPMWYDVDDQTTLARLCAALFASQKEFAPATKKFLEKIIAREGRERDRKSVV